MSKSYDNPPLFVTFRDNGRPALARIFGITDMSGDFGWVEYQVSECPFGCKIYYNPWTDDYALMHNSNYGCRNYGTH